MVDLWVMGVVSAFSLFNLMIVLIGTVLGIIFGALPGLGPTLAVSLMIPVTFGLPPDSSLILLSAVYVSSIYGGSISAILINAPGTPGSAASSFDGYPMAQSGRAGVALGISATASLLGGFVSIFFLIAFSPLIARFSLRFGAPELFLLAVFGLTIIAAVSQENIKRGLIAGGIGLLASFVGQDLMTGEVRFTFGLLYISDGIPFIVGLIGMLAASEAYKIAELRGTISRTGKIEGSVFDGIRETIKRPICVLRASIIGTIVGAIPGAGISAANFIAYSESLRTSKEPEKYGHGSVEGLIASETANNAVTGGSLIPTLTIGIPGNSSAAAFLAGIMIHGLRPGIQLFTVNSNIVVAMFVGLILANICFFVLGIAGTNLFARVTLVRNEYLVPLILVLSMVGGFAMRNRFSDIILVLLFSLMGFFMKKYRFPVVGVVLGMILGPIAEIGFRQTLLISGGSYAVFFTRPISLFLLFAIFLSLGSQFIKPIFMNFFKKRAKTDKQKGS